MAQGTIRISLAPNIVFELAPTENAALLISAILRARSDLNGHTTGSIKFNYAAKGDVSIQTEHRVVGEPFLWIIQRSSSPDGSPDDGTPSAPTT